MRQFLIVLAIVAGGVALLMVAGPAPQRPAKTFTFNNGAEPETLDPALMTGVPEHTLAMALFEGLVTYHPKTLKPVPGVAKSWTISDDGLTYTFHLRACRWSNGDPLGATDFLQSWRRALEPKTAAEYAYQLWHIKNARAYTEGKITDFSKVGVRVIDERTLEVRLENPAAYFLELLAFETFMPVHTRCLALHGKKWTRVGKIVCNGPFVLAQWLPRHRIVMHKNPLYWDAAAVKLDQVVAYPIDDENTALRTYKAGKIHWLNALPNPLIPRLKKHPHYRKAPYLGTYFYRFNCTRPPFNDRRVRIAFNLALDKDRICRYVLHGEYQPARAFVPPMMPPYQSPDGMAYAPQKAAALLADAGYPAGKGFPRVTLIYNTSKRHQRIAEVAQKQWKETLGVDINLVSQEWKVYLKTVSTLDYDIARSAWIGDYLDPKTFLDMFVTGGGNNRTGWSHKRYDQLIAQTDRTADAAARLELFREAEKILVCDELPVMPVHFYVNLSLLHPSVQGFYGNPRDLHPFKYIDINQAAPK